MAYCIVRNEKVQSNGVYGIEKHNRAKEELVKKNLEEEVKKDGYSYIELDNLKYNLELKKCEDAFKAAISNKLKEKGITKTIRKDAVLLYDTVIAYSPEKTPNLIAFMHRKNQKWKEEHVEQWNAYASLSKEEKMLVVKKEKEWCENYFQSALSYYEKNMGIPLYATIHYHEESPHLHIDGMPLSQEKDGSWSLNWKKAIYASKTEMSKFQSSFAKEVGKKFGLERGKVHEEGAIREHKTKLQWQVDSLEKKVVELEKQVEEYSSAAEAARKAYRLLRTPRGAKYEERYSKALEMPLEDARKAFDDIVEDYRDER